MAVMDPRVARILDANLNRAREALRVMEDYARFALDDRAGSESVKRLRHALADCAGTLPADALLTARDTPGDVGTRITTESERRRADARAVCTAAAKRLPEALRTLEEYAKTQDPQLAGRFEALRYRAYELEARLLLGADRTARFARVNLYVLITASLCRGDWLATAKQAIDGGAGCLQLREKDLPDRQLLERAKRLVELCRSRNVLCIVNDRPDIALLSDADGVHVGQDDLTVSDARRIVGADRLVGISTHDPAQFRAALETQSDYIAVGPMYPSPTKPQEHVPGPALLEEAVAGTERPVVAVGGITPPRVPELIAAGGRCICVCSAVLEAPDVARAARALADPFERIPAR